MQKAVWREPWLCKTAKTGHDKVNKKLVVKNTLCAVILANHISRDRKDPSVKSAFGIKTCQIAI